MKFITTGDKEVEVTSSMNRITLRVMKEEAYLTVAEAKALAAALNEYAKLK